MPDPVRRLVVVDDAQLAGMAANPQFVSAFPFLASVAQAGKARGGCGGCGRAARDRAQVYESAKAALANLGADGKRRLKQLLNAQSVRIRYVDGRRVMVKTFT